MKSDALCGAGAGLGWELEHGRGGERLKGMISRAERVFGLCDAELRADVHARGKHQASLYFVYYPQIPPDFLTWTLLASSIACPHISCVRRPGTFARNGGFRSVQLAEHQHRRRQRRWSLVRIPQLSTAFLALTRCSGNNANQAQPTSQPQSSGGLFGGSQQPQSQQQPQSGGLFGGTSGGGLKLSTPASTGGGLFGASAAQSNQPKPSLL